MLCQIFVYSQNNDIVDYEMHAYIYMIIQANR